MITTNQQLLQAYNKIYESTDYSYYKISLTASEIKYIQIITNVALQKLLKIPRQYISLPDIEQAFHESFPNLDKDTKKPLISLLEHITRSVLTKKEQTIYAYMNNWRSIPETPQQIQDLKNNLIHEITRLLQIEIQRFSKYTDIPSYRHSDTLIKNYMDQRHIQQITDRLPEIHGIF